VGLLRYLPLTSGLAAVALGFTSCAVGSGIPTFGGDAGKTNLSSEALKEFKEVLATSANPEWCKVVDSSTLTESMVYTTCYFYAAEERGLRKYKVVTCGYNSENEELGAGSNEYCEKPKDELVSNYIAGKSRRYFGNEELLPDEKDAEAQKDIATSLGFLFVLVGLILSALGFVLLVSLPSSKKS